MFLRINIMGIQKGQIVTVKYEDRDFELVVIDPDGFGIGQPTVGFGFKMMEIYSGLSQPNLSRWVNADPDNFEYIKTPSNKRYAIHRTLSSSGNEYAVLEISDCVSLAVDVIEKPGKVRQPAIGKIARFLGWFAAKGLYASAYVELKDKYSKKDDRVISEWMEVRLSGIPQRKKYTDFLQSKGCKANDFAKWTNYVYTKLFGLNAKKMREIWELVEGDESIARNYIAKEKALQRLAYCEEMVPKLYFKGLKQAHEDAIYFTKSRYSD